MNLYWQVGSDTDIGGGRENQDDYLVFQQNDVIVLCVFDGHGNNTIAKFLHLYFKDVLRNELFLSEDHSPSSFSKAIYSAFLNKNLITDNLP